MPWASEDVQDTMLSGNERDRAAAMGRLSDDLARERLQTEYPMLKDQLGFMERRNDVQPDLGLMSQLMQGYGAAGGMGGGGGQFVDMGGADYGYGPMGGGMFGPGYASPGVMPWIGGSMLAKGSGGSGFGSGLGTIRGVAHP